MAQSILLAQLAATLFMTGLIWFVQLVHYPLLAKVGPDRFAEYESAHMRRTSALVGPAMMIEFMTAIALVAFRPHGVSGQAVVIGILLLLVIWLSTVFFQMPCHHSLARAFDVHQHRVLVATNWIRLTAWSVRSVIVLWMIAAALGAGSDHGLAS